MANLETILQQGGAVILPTETVYGLFASAMNEQAVKHVYALKQRPKDKAMNLNVADFKTILNFSKQQPYYLKKLYHAFLPGPLTIILQANEHVPIWVNSGLKTIGFRVPKHPKTLELIKKIGPLIGPSANISGCESGKVFVDIQKQFGNAVSGFSDDCSITGVDSTILDLSKETACILRQGAISKNDILVAVPELVFSD